MRRKQPVPELQRRQIVIEEHFVVGCVVMWLRWDGHTQPLGALDWTLEQAKRHGASCQLGRNEDEIKWTSSEYPDYRVWYSDTVLALNGGLRPTAAQIEAYRGSPCV